MPSLPADDLAAGREALGSWEHCEVLGVPARRHTGLDGGSVTVVPGRGGKIVSLVTPSGREWLVQPDPMTWPDPGERFTEAEMCGWDECIPTVSACILSTGESLSDHGDAWSRPWSSVVRGGGLTTEVVGVDLEYSLARTITPVLGGLDLSYRLVRAGEPRPIGWAAHPQFLAEASTVVELEVDRVFENGRALPWSPELGLPPPGTGRKLWADPEPAATRAVLRHGSDALALSWAGAGYLALWCEDGLYSRHRVIAVEPSTGWGDRAADNGAPLVGDSVPVCWRLGLRW